MARAWEGASPSTLQGIANSDMPFVFTANLEQYAEMTSRTLGVSGLSDIESMSGMLYLAVAFIDVADAITGTRTVVQLSKKVSLSKAGLRCRGRGLLCGANTIHQCRNCLCASVALRNAASPILASTA